MKSLQHCLFKGFTNRNLTNLEPCLAQSTAISPFLETIYYSSSYRRSLHKFMLLET